MAFSRKLPATQNASRSSIRPTTSWSHQSSNSSFVMKATLTSKMPLISRNTPTSAASVENVSYGFHSAQMPTSTKSTPSSPCTHFQPVVEYVIAMNSFMAATSATTPNRIEIAYTVV